MGRVPPAARGPEAGDVCQLHEAGIGHLRSFARTLIWTSQRRFRAESGPWSEVRLEEMTGNPGMVNSGHFVHSGMNNANISRPGC
ncbi:hypothetical protein J2797_001248 [Paraburkholderia terricola]|jgi:hypothetical protein|nr:hypothetical protein [Paraburkholderia terricola]MDR6491361.1 hypothetical protein [Paraburkholderia terricola]